MATPVRLATSTIKSVATGGSTNFNVAGHTTDAGTDCLIVAVIWGGATTTTVSAISWNGSALTLIPSSTATQAGVTKIEWYYLLAPTIQGPATITVTMSSAARGGAIAYNYQNVNQSVPFGTAATNVSGSNNVNETVTVTSAAGELILAALAANNGDTTTVTAGNTQVTNTVLTAGGTTNSVIALIEEASGAASVAMTGTLSTARAWAASGVALKPTAGGSSWGPSLSDQLNRLVRA